jgi:hypothetical protein
MTGFGLAVLLVLALAGAMACLWLTCTYDQRRMYAKRLAYQRKWLRDWRAYQRDHPDTSRAHYIKIFKQERPVDMPYCPQRSTETLFLVAALGCAVLELILLYKAFHHWHHHDQPAYGILGAYTGFAVIASLVWIYLLLEEPRILPVYARRDITREQLLPQLPPE